jgi:TatD DNase family protein
VDYLNPMADCLVYEYRPGRLYVNLSNDCTNSCVFCARSFSSFTLGPFDLTLSREHSTKEYVDAADRYVREHQIHELVFCGYGEPTLRLDTVLRLASWGKEQGLSTRLNTNGHGGLIHGRDISSDLVSCIDRVNVSLNAPDEQSYARVSNPEPGSYVWRCVVGFLRRCRGKIPRSWASVVGRSLSPEEISAARELCSRLQVKLMVR